MPLSACVIAYSLISLHLDSPHSTKAFLHLHLQSLREREHLHNYIRGPGKDLKRFDELSCFVQDIKLVYSTTDRPKLKSPRLICGFPGSGYVGKLAVDHLIQELPANHLVDIYSGAFPPQIIIKPDGTADLMKNSIYWWHDDGAN